jgi:predicted NBD/HSP70 family sugar kinase/transcriptional regulator with XRE-family HTH domain
MSKTSLKQVDDPLAKLRKDVETDPDAQAAYEDTWVRANLLRNAKRTRRQQRLSQREVADEMGTSQSAVSDLESGRMEPQLRTLQRYARAIGRKLDIAFIEPRRPRVFGQVWTEVERSGLSLILTALATRKEGDGRRRTLAALAEAVTMPPSIVEFVLTNLLNNGWATTDGQIYSLNDKAACAVGVSLERGRVVGVLVDLDGEVVQEFSTRPANWSASAVVESAVDVVERLINSSPAERVVGVGVSIAGIVQNESGRVMFAPDLQSDEDDWFGIDLEEQLQEDIQDRLGNPTLLVVVENDANSLAIHEYLHRGDPSVLTVLLSGAGIGCGLVIEGSLVHGVQSAAGEGGHTIIELDGPPCRAGFDHNGCLETMASAQGIVKDVLGEDSDLALEDALTVVNDRIRNGDDAANETFVQAGFHLGRFLGVATALIDPSRLVLYAHREIADSTYPSAQGFQEGLQHGLDETMPTSEAARESSDLGSTSSRWLANLPRVEWHILGSETSAKAAGSVAIRHFLARPARWAPAMLPANDAELAGV